jgi:predicted oxidoreductase
MQKIQLSNKLEISRLVHGMWRLKEWNLSDNELLKLVEQAIDLGITTFDHADIYGDYTCEHLFGNALNLNKAIRNQIQLISKCGIKLISDKFPERKIKHYDYSSDYIIFSVENSLRNLRVEHIDLLLLHRPAPLFNPEEVANAFSKLRLSGKVLNFGVSNFNPVQFEMLNDFMDEQLVTNQVEISPYNLENFENGNIDFFLKENIKPMAWSPLGGGKIMHPDDEKGERIKKVISEIAEEVGTKNLNQILISWLLKHPSSIIPVLGSGKIQHIKSAVHAFHLDLSLEQWYRIYLAGLGRKLP